MNLKLALVTASVALAASCVHASNGSSAGAVSHVGHLSCGLALLTAETAYLDINGQDRQTLSQRITLRRPDVNGSIVLPSDSRSLRQPFLKDTPVLDASITGWACVKAADGTAYIYVLYTCVESTLRPDCADDQREWVRLFDLQGKLINPGFPHEGLRTPELMKKLGLGHYLDDGVSLQDVDD
jgi:hypothetical protein